MKKLIVLSLAVAGFGLVTSPAQAGFSFSISLGHAPRSCPPPVYVAPPVWAPPVVVPAPPVCVTPVPVARVRPRIVYAPVYPHRGHWVGYAPRPRHVYRPACGW